MHQRVRRRLAVRFGDRDLARAGFTYDVSEGGLFILTDARPPSHRRVHLQIFLQKDAYILAEAVAIREKVVPSGLKAAVKGGFAVRFLPPGELLRDTVLKSAGGASSEEMPRAAAPLEMERPGAPSPGIPRQPMAGASVSPANETPRPPASDGTAGVPSPHAAPGPGSQASPPASGPKVTSSGRWIMATGKPTDPFVIEIRSIEELRQALAGELRYGRVLVQTPIMLPPNSMVHVDLRVAFAGKSHPCTARVTLPDAGVKGLRLILDQGRTLASELESLLPR